MFLFQAGAKQALRIGQGKRQRDRPRLEIEPADSLLCTFLTIVSTVPIRRNEAMNHHTEEVSTADRDTEHRR